MNSTKGFTRADSKQKLRQGLEDFPRLGRIAEAPVTVSMGLVLLLASAMPKSKAILAAQTRIASAENLPRDERAECWQQRRH